MADPAPTEKGTRPTFRPTSINCGGQTAEWIKMPLGTKVGLGRPHCVSCGPGFPKYGHSPPLFGPCRLWPNGWINQGAILCTKVGLAQPYCVRWEPNSPTGAQPPIFGPGLLWLNGNPSQRWELVVSYRISLHFAWVVTIRNELWSPASVSMYVCLSVCVCVCVSASACLYYTDPDETWGSGRGCPL